MKSTDAKAAYADALASVAAAENRSFPVLWKAFKVFARLAVDDIERAGTQDDTIECAFGAESRDERAWERRSEVTQATLARQFERPVKPQFLQLTVIAVYDVPPPERTVSFHGFGGDPTAVDSSASHHRLEPPVDLDVFIEQVESHAFTAGLDTAGQPLRYWLDLTDLD